MFTKIAQVLTLVAALTAPRLAHAQALDALGSRASALAAFVAIADDASAVVWNPAGLVSGPLFNISLDFGRTTAAPERLSQDSGGAERVATRLVAIGTTPLGLAYYRLATVVAGPAVTPSDNREDRQVEVRTLVTSHVGATVQQSVGDYLTLGATVKLVRGSVATGTLAVSSWGEALDRADEFDTEGSTTADVDLGAMFAAGRARIGMVVRNVTEPAFADDRGVLDRHGRVGVAWGNRWPGISPLVVAVDADLTRVPHPAGERRDVAAGVERWVRGRKMGVRGGLRASTVGDARPVASGGFSYAVRAGSYVDAYVMGGRDTRGWGIAARVSY